MEEIRLLLAPHPTGWHKQQMAQPQAAGRDSHLHVPARPSPKAEDGEEQGKVQAQPRWTHHLESAPWGWGGNVTQCSATVR